MLTVNAFNVILCCIYLELLSCWWNLLSHGRVVNVRREMISLTF